MCEILINLYNVYFARIRERLILIRAILFSTVWCVIFITHNTFDCTPLDLLSVAGVTWYFKWHEIENQCLFGKIQDPVYTISITISYLLSY